MLNEVELQMSKTSLFYSPMMLIVTIIIIIIIIITMIIIIISQHWKCSAKNCIEWIFVSMRFSYRRN